MSDIKVRAKFAQGKFGWYDNRRIRDGDEFTIDEKLFSEKWMVRLEEEKPAKKAPKAPKAPPTITLDDD